MISRGNHVKFAHFVFLAVSEEAQTIFFFVQCIIKQLLDSVFVISRIIKVSVGYQPQPSASADNPYLDLDYSGYHKKPHPIIVYNHVLHDKEYLEFSMVYLTLQ